MKLVAGKKSEQDISIIDPWSLVHFSAGLALGLRGTGLATTTALNVGYEAVEYVAQRTNAGATFFNQEWNENPSNMIMDILAVTAGWYLGHRWNQT